MSFISAEEHIILLEWPYLALSGEDLLALRDCGIRTAYTWLDWDVVEPRPGVTDWSLYDRIAQLYEKAGMRLLLLCHSCAIDWAPESWYALAPGRLWRRWVGWHGAEHYTVISPWSVEGQAAELAFMQRCVDHFAGSNVQCVRGSVHGGELFLPGLLPSYYDAGAIASYRAFVGDATALPADLPTFASMDEQPATVAWLRASLTAMVTAQQRIFAAQPWREIWFMTAEHNRASTEGLATGPRTGNWLLPELCRTLPAALDAELNLLFFEVYRRRGPQTTLDNVRPYWQRLWVGSQFCEGLRSHTADAIARGLRGFLTGPVHPASRHQRFEPWMLEAFAWSQEQWAASRSERL